MPGSLVLGDYVCLAHLKATINSQIWGTIVILCPPILGHKIRTRVERYFRELKSHSFNLSQSSI